MDLEDVQLDLEALKKLYGLLNTDGDSMQNSSSENLDKKARLLLKNLLDVATAKAFEGYSQIIAAQLGLVNTPCFTQPQPPEGTMKQRPPDLPVVSKTFSSVVQSSNEDLKFPKISFSKDEQESTDQAIASDWSKLSIGTFKPENRRKRCRVCQRSVKHPSFTEQAKISNMETQNQNKDISLQNHESIQFPKGPEKGLDSNNNGVESARSIEKQRENIISEIQGSSSGIGFLAFSPKSPGTGNVKSLAVRNFIAETSKKPKETDDISKGASNVIQQIELRISALELVAENVGSSEKSAGQHVVSEMLANSNLGAASVSSQIQTAVTRNELSQPGGFVVGINDSPSRLVTQSVRLPKDSSLLHQAVSQITEMTGPNPMASQTLRRLPPSTELSQSSVFVVGRNDLPSQVVSQSVLAPQKSKRWQQGASQIADMTWLNPSATQTSKPFAPSNAGPSQLTSETKENRGIALLHDPFSVGKPTEEHKLPHIPNVAPHLPAKLPRHINKENMDQNQMMLKKTVWKAETSKLSTPSVGSTNFVQPYRKIQAIEAGHRLNQAQTRGTTRNKKDLPRHNFTNPTMSSTLYKDQTDYKRGGFKKNKKHISSRKKMSIHLRESEGSTSSSYSQDWTRHQVDTSGDESEEYSLTGQHSSQHLSSESESPTASSENDMHSLPSRTEGSYTSPSSSSHSELYSLPSRRGGHESRTQARAHAETLQQADFTDSESEYTTPDEIPANNRRGSTYWSPGSQSRKMGLTKYYKSGNQAKPEKQSGRLRKLKDKLAIIFHHHHHHHHHHRDDNGKHGDHRTKVAQKHGQKISRQMSKNEAYGEQAVKKLRNSALHNVADENQRGQFHTLVEGLLRHVKHSNKSKLPKDGVGRLARGQNGGKKVAKKLHWWQMLRRHRGVKMTNKHRVKLGFGSKKPPLRALPKMR